MNQTEVGRILRRFDFYQAAAEKWQRAFLQNGLYRRAAAGEQFFHEGDQCAFVGLLGAGSIRVFKIGETGREITLYRLQPGESCVLNMSCTLSKMPYPANAVVEQDSELVLFPAALFREWVGQVDALREFAFALMSHRISQMMALLEEISFKKMDARMAEFLLQRFRDDGRELRLTHQQIAAELGTAREVVTRLLQELSRIGAVEPLRGRIRLRNERALRSLLSER